MADDSEHAWRMVSEYADDVARMGSEISDLRAENSRLIEQIARNQLEMARLQAALDKIASYGERHIGYVNCKIEGRPLSRFAREALTSGDSRTLRESP